MNSIIKLDTSLIRNKMKWEHQLDTEHEKWAPKYTPGYLGIYANYDMEVEKTELVVNSKLTLPLDCSIAPIEGFTFYHVLIAPNPRLFEVAEVSCPSLVLPGAARIQPVVHLRGLRKFDVADLGWIATLHLID